MKSSSGYLVAVNSTRETWKSARQTVVAFSSAEAKYTALSTCAKTVIWLRRFQLELMNKREFVDTEYQLPYTSMFSDSTAALLLATSSQVFAKSTHIETKYYRLRRLIDSGKIELHHISTTEQVADVFTKPVNYKTL